MGERARPQVADCRPHGSQDSVFTARVTTSPGPGLTGLSWAVLGVCVCVCACMHTCGAGRQGQRAGREHRGQSGQGSRPLQGQLPTARASFLQDTRFPGQEAKRQGPATLYNKGVHSPVVQWLRLHAPSREFDPWSGN